MEKRELCSASACGHSSPSLPSLPAPLLQVNRTTLFFPQPLSEIYGNAMEWSFMGGFLT